VLARGPRVFVEAALGLWAFTLLARKAPGAKLAAADRAMGDVHLDGGRLDAACFFACAGETLRSGLLQADGLRRMGNGIGRVDPGVEAAHHHSQRLSPVVALHAGSLGVRQRTATR